MGAKLSRRLAAIVDALPLRPGARVLEIGCGPGAAARAIAHRLGSGHVLAIDRSIKAVELATVASAAEIDRGLMSVRCVPVERFELLPGEAPFDFAFAVRVGVLDGRHPRQAEEALMRIRRALVSGGRLYIDGGNPLREIHLT